MDRLKSAEGSALDPIWRTHEVRGDGVLPLRAHVELLGETIFEITQEQPSASAAWHAVSDQLRMASFLEDVRARAPDTRTAVCGGVAGSDHAFGEMAQVWLAGSMVFALVWQAYELAVSIRKPSSTSQGKDGVALAASAGRGRDVRHLAELTGAVTAHLPELLSDRRKAKLQERIAEIDVDGSAAGLAASGLASLRNALMHADLVAPLTLIDDDEDDAIEDDPKILVLNDAIRLTLVLIQILFAGAFEDEETEFDGEVVGVGALMDRLHMRDAPAR